MIDRPQEHHADLGLVDDDNTEMLTASKWPNQLYPDDDA